MTMLPKTVVITGASAGVGRATAVEFARHGWRVALLARSHVGLEGARAEVEAAGGEALALPTDVANPKLVEAAADRVECEWGPIGVWVNNAMATIFSDFMSIDPKDFERSTQVTYLGTVWGTQAALKRMRPRNMGSIVQVGSALAYRSIPLQSAYCGAKAAIRGFTDSLRCELLHDDSDVKLSMVHLSSLNTPQFEWSRTTFTRQPQPLGKIFQPEVAAQAIYHVALHPRREMWVGAPAVQAIMGTRLLPGLLDRLIAWKSYDSQLDPDRAQRRTRQDNLWRPPDVDLGSHGRFDGRARRSSVQLWLDTNRTLATGAALGAIGLLAFMRRKRSEPAKP